MTAIVIDGRVAVKWVVEEDDSEAATDLARYELWAPDLMWVESANALWAKARRGELDAGEVVERVEVLGKVPVTLVPQQELLEHALRLALELEHPVYDCLYLACALRQGTYVVTADRRFVRVVRKQSTHGDSVRLLSESRPQS